MAYSNEEIDRIFNSICERIEKGESLRSVLRSEDMPSSRTFFKWIDQSEEKVKQYARATTIRADEMFDEIIDIADNTGDDMITLDDGREVVNHGVIQRDRLRVDARKWALSKMNPKKFGDKVDIDHTTKGKSIEPTRIVFKKFDE